MEPTYIWGLDLSLACTGIAIYDLKTKKFIVTDHFLTTKIKQTDPSLDLMSYRLYQITKFIKKYYKQYPPTAVGIERLYIPPKGKGLLSAEVNYRVHGIVNAMLYQIPQYYYPSTTIKARVQSGKSAKQVVKFSLVANFPELKSLFTHENYGNRKTPKWTDEDEGDACGAALTLMLDEGLITYEKPSLSKVDELIKEEETINDFLLKRENK